MKNAGLSCSFLGGLCVFVGVIGVFGGTKAGGSEREQARQLLATTGIQGGLIVHLGCGDGRFTAALLASESYLVQGLDADREHVEAARRRMQAEGRLGSITIERLEGTRLPYIDNLVNLIVVQEQGGIADAELLRVLTPNGTAIRVDSQHNKVGAPLKKPWPSAIDQWTHYLHDASNNALAEDTQVGPPRHIQWWAGPKRSRHHDSLASMSAMVSAGGRVFYILDEGPTGLMHYPSQWKLIARDAFNGVVLWKRDINDWINQLYYFRSGPNWLPRRLVAVGDRVYVTLGLETPICALDAATGRQLQTYAGSQRTEELIWHKNVLLAVVGDPKAMNGEAPKIWHINDLFVQTSATVSKAIVAYEADTGRPLWKQSGNDLARIAPLSLAASEERVFYLDREYVHCLELQTGREQWRSPFPTEGLYLRAFAPTLVVGNGVVLCMSERRLTALAVGDGRKLWETKGNLGFCSSGDLFVVGDKVWTTPVDFGPGKKGLDLLSKDKLFKAFDLRTGTIKQTVDERDIWTLVHHHRCYRNKATTNFLITGRRGMEFIGLNGQPCSVNNWVRGLCQYGIMPANGLCYKPPDPCRCYSDEKIDGFWALSSRSSIDQEAAAPAAERLLHGLAFGKVFAREGARSTADDWPTYRHDVARSGAATTTLPRDLGLLRETQLNGSLTSPVVAEDRILVADKTNRTVFCLDAQTGRQRWQYAEAGPLDSPPSCSLGLVFFGSLDGHVYALRAADGVLVWRYRAAPVDRCVVADGHLESVWPVSGSVLVLDGVVYGAAGRSSHLDGGIHLFGLDARTGRPLYSKRICGLPSVPSSGKKSAVTPDDAGPDVIQAPALPDVLVAEGNSIMMRQLAFDKQLAPSKAGSFLKANSGLLEDVWSARFEWSLKQHHGKLLAFDENAVYSLQQPYALVYTNQPLSHRGEHHQQFATYSPEEFPTGVYLEATALHPPANADAASDKAKTNSQRKAKGKAQEKGSGKASSRWKITLPLQARAMVLAGERLYVAGWLDQVSVQAGAGTPVSNRSPGPARIWVLSTADGSKVAEYPLSAPPVFDGMIAANERLYVSTSDGKLVCFGNKTRNP
jgi:outer membrane protein assembly factor BamB